MFKPQRLGTVTIPDAELTTDKKSCKKIGPCGVGEKAIYLNSFYFDRRYYIPISRPIRSVGFFAAIHAVKSTQARHTRVARIVYGCWWLGPIR